MPSEEKHREGEIKAERARKKYTREGDRARQSEQEETQPQREKDKSELSILYLMGEEWPRMVWAYNLSELTSLSTLSL